jgi:hypothetical protein
VQQGESEQPHMQAQQLQDSHPSQQEQQQQQQEQPQQQELQQQQQQEQPQQQEAALPLPTNLTISVGPADEPADDDLIPEPAQQQQPVFVPPPLIDPNVDIANDPAYAIRLMDILDQIASSSSSSMGLTSGPASMDQVRSTTGTCFF